MPSKNETKLLVPPIERGVPSATMLHVSVVGKPTGATSG
jgi:hypothetical protein